MTPRERNLLIIMVVIAFTAVNFLAYRVWYQPRMEKLENATATAQREIKINETEMASMESVQTDKDWLTRFEPKPMTTGKAQTRIQQLADNEAARRDLTRKDNTFGAEVVDPILNYHRVRYEMKVNGPEEKIYGWIDKIHNPNEFRIVSFVRLSPQRDDATRADCEIYIDQWFVPEGDPS